MAFTINGVTVHEPAKDGITITEEPVWAPNTGRSQTGKMTGDIVAWKRTFAVTWPPLSFEDANTIMRAIETADAFFPITFTNTRQTRNGSNQLVNQVITGDELTMNSTNETATVYTSSIPRTVASLASAYRRHAGVTITFIEQ